MTIHNKIFSTLLAGAVFPDGCLHLTKNVMASGNVEVLRRPAILNPRHHAL